MAPDTRPAFELSVLQDCASGECGLCGRCCVAFTVDVPSVPGDAFSPVVRKRIGEVCPQLIRLDDGRYGCAVHDRKADTDTLRVCRDWDGTGEGYPRLLDNMREIVFCADTPGKRAHVLRSFREGLLADVDLRIGGTGDFVCAVSNYLEEPSVPDALFEAMGMKEYISRALEDRGNSCRHVLGVFGVRGDSAHPAKRAFYEAYVLPAEGANGLPTRGN